MRCANANRSELYFCYLSTPFPALHSFLLLSKIFPYLSQFSPSFAFIPYFSHLSPTFYNFRIPFTTFACFSQLYLVVTTLSLNSQLSPSFRNLSLISRVVRFLTSVGAGMLKIVLTVTVTVVKSFHSSYVFLPTPPSSLEVLSSMKIKNLNMHSEQ